MTTHTVRCPHKPIVSACPECWAVLNSNVTPNQVDAVDEIFEILNGSGAHACYCQRSVDGGCKCALKDEYIVEAKAKFNALLVAARISENDWFFATTKKWLTKLDRTIPDELGAELQEHYEELEKLREAL